MMIKYIWTLLIESKNRKNYFLWVSMSLLSSFFVIVPPIMIGRLIDIALPSGVFRNVLIYVVCIAGAFMLNSVLNITSKYWLETMIQEIIASLRIRMFNIYYKKKLRNLLEMGTDALYQRATQSLKTIQEKIELIARDVFGVTIAALVSFIVIFWIDIWIPFLFLAIYAPYIWLRSYIFKKKGHTFYEQVESQSRIIGVIRELAQGIKLIKSSGTDAIEQKRFDQVQKDNLKIQIHHVHVFSSLLTLNILMTLIPEAIVYGYLGYKVFTGSNTIGNILVVAGLLGHIRHFVWQISRYGMMFQEFKTHLYRIYEIEQLPDDPFKINKGKDQSLIGEIQFDNVTFQYGSGQVLENFSLRIRTGTSVGIVGMSGVGKTTLANMLVGLEQPTDGLILLDGMPLEYWNIESIRRQICYVTQQPFLLNGTIRENVTYGLEGIQEDDIWRSLELSELDDFVKGLEKRLDEVIGEHGIQLSGGQKQRLVLARAHLRKPQIVILDEATASLDLETEHRVQQAFQKLCEGKTSLIIAHRLTTLRYVDRIIVLKDGRIVEEGKHEELMKSKGLYYQMYTEPYRSEQDQTGDEIA